MVPGCMPPLIGRWSVMAAWRKQRPLIRYAGSAAETSIGSKPIGSELNVGVYPRRHFCQASLALAQPRGYLPGLRQKTAPRSGEIAVPLCSKRGFDLAHTWPMGQSRPPTSLSKGTIGTLSDKPCPIGNSRAIENGRYVSVGKTHQSLISITAGAARSIATFQHPSHSRTTT